MTGVTLSAPRMSTAYRSFLRSYTAAYTTALVTKMTAVHQGTRTVRRTVVDREWVKVEGTRTRGQSFQGNEFWRRILLLVAVVVGVVVGVVGGVVVCVVGGMLLSVLKGRRSRLDAHGMPKRGSTSGGGCSTIRRSEHRRSIGRSGTWRGRSLRRYPFAVKGMVTRVYVIRDDGGGGGGRSGDVERRASR